MVETSRHLLIFFSGVGLHKSIALFLSNFCSTLNKSQLYTALVKLLFSGRRLCATAFSPNRAQPQLPPIHNDPDQRNLVRKIETLFKLFVCLFDLRFRFFGHYYMEVHKVIPNAPKAPTEYNNNCRQSTWIQIQEI